MTKRKLNFGLVRINGNFGLSSSESDERREDFRREGDILISDIMCSMMLENDIHKSLDIVLEALKSHGYIAPRIYRYRQTEDECELMASLDLPEIFRNEKVRFSVQQDRALREIINEEHMCYSPKIHSDLEGELTENDPLHYIKENGLIGIPYIGESCIYPKQIKGAIVVSYDPNVKDVGTREFRVLRRVGEFVGSQVARILEYQEHTKRKKELEIAKGKLESVIGELEIANVSLAQANMELEQANARLKELSFTDGLTELYNRRKFHQDLKESFRLYNREGKNNYLALIDLDHFKQINDAYGHVGGDQILEEIGKIISMFKDEGIVGYRQGGDEFAMLIETDSADYVRTIVGKLNEGISRHHKIPFSITVGAERIRTYHNNWEEWYRGADDVLYKAKENRGSVIVMD